MKGELLFLSSSSFALASYRDDQGIKQQRRKVEQVGYIHTRYKTPLTPFFHSLPVSSHLLPTHFIKVDSPDQLRFLPGCGGTFMIMFLRVAKGKEGVKIFFREFIVHYFIRNAIMFSFSPPILFVSNKIHIAVHTRDFSIRNPTNKL